MPRKASAPFARKKTSTASRQKRSRGRPGAKDGAVGRDAIVSAARQLLEKLPPHQVPTVLIARKAGVDPALVRYYFSSRQALVLAVIESMLTEWIAGHPDPDAGPAVKLAKHISEMVDFARSTRSMQRLMIDECAEAKSPDIRNRVRELNAAAIEVYAKFFDQNEAEPLEPADPLLVFVAIIGMCEFFVAAQAMIVPLLPQKMSAEALTERYKRFIVKMVLDGLRPRIGGPPSAATATP